jgi:hypothetical protein
MYVGPDAPSGQASAARQFPQNVSPQICRALLGRAGEGTRPYVLLNGNVRFVTYFGNFLVDDAALP